MADDTVEELVHHSALLRCGRCRSPDSRQCSYLRFQRWIRASEETTVKEQHKQLGV